MNERIKSVRKSLHLTQEAFGKTIGLAQNSIANYEIGRREPPDAVILSICREFHVNERWLRTGEGEMFHVPSRDEEIAAFVGSALSGEAESFQRRVLSALARLSEAEWAWLEEKAREIVGEPADPSAHATGRSSL